MEKQSYELITRMAKHHDVVSHVYNGSGSKLFWFWNLKKEVRKLLKIHPDIQLIHLNDGLMAAACTWLQKETSIPIVPTYHGLDITFPAQIFQKRIIPKMHKYTAAISVSEATRQACIERGFPSDAVHTVLNGVDHDLAEIPKEDTAKPALEKAIGMSLDDKKIIITMGRAVKRKGFSWFLKEVVPHLDEQTIFLMIGPINRNPGIGGRIINLLPKSFKTKMHLMLGIATDTDAILDALENPELRDKVFHLGKVPFKDLMQYLALADVFVMPNIKVDGDAEGFGLVALEASLRGTPVIAAGIEGIVDAVREGDNGILLPSGNAPRWIETINSLLKNKVKLQKLSTSAISKTLNHYGWDKMVLQYNKIFEKIMKSKI